MNITKNHWIRYDESFDRMFPLILVLVFHEAMQFALVLIKQQIWYINHFESVHCRWLRFNRFNCFILDENQLRAKGYDKTPDFKLEIPVGKLAISALKHK